MMDQALLELVARAAKGYPGAFEQLCREKATDILYVCIRLLGNIEDGEDAAQEILSYMHAHIRELKEAKAFLTWLYRIIHGVCSNMRRKEKMAQLTFEEKDLERFKEDDYFLPQSYMEDQNKRRQLIAVLNDLPYDCKICVYMYYFDKMRYKEIAGALSVGRKDIDNTMMKARRLIRRGLFGSVSEEQLMVSYTTLVPVITQVIRYDVTDLVSGEMTERLVRVSAGAVPVSAALAGRPAAAPQLLRLRPGQPEGGCRLADSRRDYGDWHGDVL